MMAATRTAIGTAAKEWVPSQSPRTWFIINATLVVFSWLQLMFILKYIRDSRPDDGTAGTTTGTDIGDSKRPGGDGARPFYLIWNFTTTFAWLVEVGMETWWNGYHKSHWSFSQQQGGDDAEEEGGEEVGEDTQLLHQSNNGNTGTSMEQNQNEIEEAISFSLSFSSSKETFNTLLGQILEILMAIYFSIGSLVLLWKWKIKHVDVSASMYDVIIGLIFYLYAMIRDYSRMYQASKW